jgi:hypothetical protein
MPRWTPESRKHHAEVMKLKIRLWQPWEHSTGAKTTEGKARSATNSTKHGGYSSEIKRSAAAFKRFLKAHDYTPQLLKHHFPELNHNEQVIIPLLEVCKRLGIEY